MTGLVVNGDSQSWLNNGYAISSLAARLDRALADADSGASSAERAWYGPASADFSASWASQYTSYEELLDLVVRAARAITAYGQALEGSQARARALEYAWCAAGLVVASDGYMALPVGAAALSPEARLPLEHALTDANRDIAQLSGTTEDAVTALMMALNPVLALLEEFGLAGFGIAFVERFGAEVGHDMANEFKDIGHDALSALHLAGHLTEELAPEAEWHGIDGADASTGFWIAGFALTTGEVIWDARHQGYLASIENHAGRLVSAATVGLAIDGAGWVADSLIAAGALAGAPEVLVAVGVGVLGVAVAVGVGAVVQAVVHHNRARINHVVHDIGSIF